MSTANINRCLVFLSFSFSTSSGLCFLSCGHFLLQRLGVPGFTALPPHTSGKVGFVGGAFIALPLLAMRNVPSDLSQSLECPFVVVFFLAIVAVGAAQGYVGARIWRGRIYIAANNQKLPSVLGVGSASLAGAVGALSLVVVTIGFLVITTLFFDFILPKDRHRRRRARPPDPVLPEPEEVVQDHRYSYPLPVRRELPLTFTFSHLE